MLVTESSYTSQASENSQERRRTILEGGLRAISHNRVRTPGKGTSFRWKDEDGKAVRAHVEDYEP